MPDFAEFSDITQMAWALTVIAGCALATVLRSFGFTRWFPPKVRRLVQKCRAKLKRKPKAAQPFGMFQLPDAPGPQWHTVTWGEPSKPAPTKRPTGKRKRRPKA
jgi:hypothetical protein